MEIVISQFGTVVKRRPANAMRSTLAQKLPDVKISGVGTFAPPKEKSFAEKKIEDAKKRM